MWKAENKMRNNVQDKMGKTAEKLQWGVERAIINVIVLAHDNMWLETHAITAIAFFTSRGENFRPTNYKNTVGLSKSKAV